MQSKNLEYSEIEELKVSSLPTRPTAPGAFGGRGYNSSEMKAAFDKLPLYLFEKLKLLIEDLTAEGEDSYVGGYKTGIKEGHDINTLLSDIVDGNFAKYLVVNGINLHKRMIDLNIELAYLKERLDELSC